MPLSPLPLFALPIESPTGQLCAVQAAVRMVRWTEYQAGGPKGQPLLKTHGEALATGCSESLVFTDALLSTLAGW